MHAYTRSLLRSWCICAAFTSRGMQNLGLLYALEPALNHLYPDLDARIAAYERHATHVNTHPFWAQLLVGLLIQLEEQSARGAIPVQILPALRNTTATTLSAIGDSVLNGTILVTWALFTALLALSGHILLAAISTLVICCVAQAIRVVCFFLGLREGLAVLERLRHLDCINWGDRLKIINAMLLAVLAFLFWPFTPNYLWLLAVFCLVGTGFVILRYRLRRVFLWYLCALVIGLVNML